ncbi:MAG: Unknown protein [uncultured Sulfurovum sp.]|uniref:Uncharacterized protein n=1 Tax=uncultured Sulfurovum sp. TaxID=269237 RepID=A0A6S6TTY7_9BACT|nr:MAG: Unknown protein [uncultured Sulfurovum sp.]
MKLLLKSTVSTLALFLLFSLASQAQSHMQHPSKKMMSEKQIKKMDRKHKKHKATRRSFKSQQEFLHKRKRLSNNTHTKHMDSNSRFNHGKHYNQSNNGYKKPMPRQRGYRHFKRGWMLAYRYDRASFYDSEGFYYGYFNRHGYYFEDTFYRYDRFYSYRDRVRGRGLFDNNYYMPSACRKYGFCNKRENNYGYAPNHRTW